MAELMTQARHATLLDLLDRLLGKGVVAYGDVILSIADLDLVYLNLRAVLSAIGTLEKYTSHSPIPPIAGGAGEEAILSPLAGEGGGGRKKPFTLPPTPSHQGRGEMCDNPILQNSRNEIPRESPSDSSGTRRLELDPQKVEQGLAKLVLTLINLLRKLMERQAIRRMEQGTLTEAQMERSGQAFKRLDQKMEELKKQFGLADEDLNLDLGPLGELV